MRPATRPLVVWVSAWPTVRGLRVYRLLAGTGLGVALLLLVWAQSSEDALGWLVVGGLLTAASAGFALDDPSASTLAASPTSIGWRRVLAIAIAALLLGAAWWSQLAIAVRIDPSLVSVRSDLTVEVLAIACVGLAFAAFAARTSDDGNGLAASLAVLAFVALVAGGEQLVPSSWPWPSMFPGTHVERWWVVAALAIAALAWSSRDPGRARAARR